jgi:hypothetical protein
VAFGSFGILTTNIWRRTGVNSHGHNICMNFYSYQEIFKSGVFQAVNCLDSKMIKVGKAIQIGPHTNR